MSKFNYKVPGDCIQQDLINNAIPETFMAKGIFIFKKIRI